MEVVVKRGLTISIICNIILLASTIILILGKGVSIENHTHQHQHQEQFQGQLMMNFIMYKGNKIEWKEKNFKSRKDGIDFLTTLPPQESYFAKIIHPGPNNFQIIYPKFLKLK